MDARYANFFKSLIVLMVIFTAYYSCVVLTTWSPPKVVFPRSYMEQDTDDNDSVHYPPPDVCRDTRLMSPGTFPLIGLLSAPGSGNTWVRYLLERATGIATGSVFNSGILEQNGFIGEKRDYQAGETLTVKMHGFRAKATAVILLVRNPFKAMVAEFNRRHAGKTGQTSTRAFAKPEWNEFVTKSTNKWLDLAQKAIGACIRHTDPTSNCKSLLIVYYEHLQRDLNAELRRLLQYLPWEIDEERLFCVLVESEGRFHRPPRNGTFDPFTHEQKLKIRDAIESFNGLINKEKTAMLPKPPRYHGYAHDNDDD